MSAFDKILNINEMFGNQLAGDDLSVPASVYKSIPTYGDFRKARAELARLQAIVDCLLVYINDDPENDDKSLRDVKYAIAAYEKAVQS